MRCKVPKCRNELRQNRKISYFSFPKDEKTLKIWLKFCQMKRKDLTTNFAVCAEHFAPELIEGSMQVEMGFGTKVRLAPGAVPTIRFPKKSVRNKNIEKRNNKKLVDSLLAEYTAQIREAECETLTQATEFVEVAMESESESETDSETSSEEDLEIIEPETLSDERCSLIDPEETTQPVRVVNHIDQNIETLEKENKKLQHENALLKERLLSVEKRYQYEINDLKEKLEKSELEKKALEERINEMEPMWTIISTS